MHWCPVQWSNLLLHRRQRFLSEADTALQELCCVLIRRLWVDQSSILLCIVPANILLWVFSNIRVHWERIPRSTCDAHICCQKRCPRRTGWCICVAVSNFSFLTLTIHMFSQCKTFTYLFSGGCCSLASIYVNRSMFGTYHRQNLFCFENEFAAARCLHCQPQLQFERPNTLCILFQGHSSFVHSFS